jgi:hypothetical protein
LPPRTTASVDERSPSNENVHALLRAEHRGQDKAQRRAESRLYAIDFHAYTMPRFTGSREGWRQPSAVSRSRSAVSRKPSQF